MLKLSLDALEIVETIARRGSFAGAAKELFRVPSTISYTVSKLEDDLGVRLFDRFGPKVALTAAGKELLKEGRFLLRAAGDLESRVRRVASGWETELTIGIDSMLAPAGLQPEIEAFYGVADQTRLRLVSEVLSGTWDALLDRRADLLVGAAGEGPSGGGYTAEPMGSIRFVFAVAPTHPLAAIDRALEKADLLDHRVVAVSDSARQLGPRTVGLLYGQDTVTVPDMETKFGFQLRGIGVGFLPEPWARPAIDAGLLVEKETVEPKPDESFYLAWRSGEEGAALSWWLRRIRESAPLTRMVTRHCHEAIAAGQKKPA